MEGYVGLDVHSKRSVFVIEREDGHVVARGDIPTTPEGFRELRRQHELAAETPVALETGTVAFYAARELVRVGLRPVVIDAHEVRVKAHRPQQKSDRRDAFELCEGLRRGQYRSVVHVPPARIGALRETLSRRRHFVAVRVAEVNAVKRLLRGAGLGHLSKGLGTNAAWAKLLAALAPSRRCGSTWPSTTPSGAARRTRSRPSRRRWPPSRRQSPRSPPGCRRCPGSGRSPP
jgi:transposase